MDVEKINQQRRRIEMEIVMGIWKDLSVAIVVSLVAVHYWREFRSVRKGLIGLSESSKDQLNIWTLPKRWFPNPEM